MAGGTGDATGRGPVCVLAAVVLGVLFGSLACTVAMTMTMAVAASGGTAELSVPDAQLQVAGAGDHGAGDHGAGHHGFGHHGFGDHGFGDHGDVTVPGASSEALQMDGHGGHPGMACVAAIDLRFPGAAPSTSTGTADVRPDGACVDRVVDVEPPVPRFS